MSEEDTRSNRDKFMLRLPDGMRERIRQVAETNQRSMNSEILATLLEAYPEGDELNLIARSVTNRLKKLTTIDNNTEQRREFSAIVQELRRVEELLTATVESRTHQTAD